MNYKKQGTNASTLLFQLNPIHRWIIPSIHTEWVDSILEKWAGIRVVCQDKAMNERVCVCVCLFVSASECVQVSNSCVDLLRSMFFWSCVDTRLLASLNSKKSPTLINVGFCSTNCVMSISAWLPNTCAVNWYIVERERERELLVTDNWWRCG